MTHFQSFQGSKNERVQNAPRKNAQVVRRFPSPTQFHRHLKAHDIYTNRNHISYFSENPREWYPPIVHHNENFN